ncbi:MAG: ABC transporter permease subunit [Defluviitaleaceae bacterium]|nr:ABC transporter permease subunit [Defluviitaleaceae bacterium]
MASAVSSAIKEPSVKKQKRNRLWQRIYRRRFLYLLFLPVFIYFVVFRYLPMWGLLIVFQDFRPFLGFAGSNWVGLAHFRNFLTDPRFWNVVVNTVVLSIYGIIFVFPAPIILALMINELRNMKFKRIVQTISYLPWFISTVVVVSLITSILSPTMGPIGQLFRSMGRDPINFLGRVEYYRTIFTLSNIWSTVGFGSIIFLAAIAGVDQQLYEAAIIDGAGKMKQLLHVTLPSIMPTIIIMLILRMGSIMDSDFERNFLLGNEATRPNADVIATFVFRTGIHQTNFSFASAVGLFNSLIALIFVWGTNRISKKTTETSLW